MKWNLEQKLEVLGGVSLKSRMAIAVSCVFILFSAGMAYFALAYFERELKRSISTHLFSIASMQADIVDNKLGLAHEALISRAAAVSSELISNPDKAQVFLDKSISLRSTFDNGLFLFSKEGKLIAETPFLPNRRGKDFSYREYYKATMATAKPVISEPYLSTHSPGSPAIILTVPIVDGNGAVKAILAGSFNLLGKNFLKDVAQARIGKSGYIYIFNKDRRLIVHPEEERIMTVAASPGINPAFDRAVAGFEGSDQTINSRGTRMLVSYKRLCTTDWGVAATGPLEEAYAPLYKARIFFIAATIAGTLLMLGFAWFLMRRLLKPLQSLVHEVEALPAKPAEQRMISVTPDMELKVLESAFNEMLMTLAQQQEALRESELNFRALAENANDGMLIASEKGKFVYANKRIAEITGYSIQELVELSIEQLFHPSGLVEMMSRHLKTLAGRDVPKHHETLLASKDGTPIPVEVSSSRTEWHNQTVELIIVRDITDRKIVEDKLQAERRLFIGGPTVVFKRKAEEGRPVEYVSPNILYQFGYHPEEFISGKVKFPAIVHPDDLPQVKAELASLEKSDAPYIEREYRIKRVDGDYRYVYDLTVAQKDGQDKISYYLGYIIDITERKHAEERLARAEKLVTKVSQIAKIGSWEFNVRANRIYCSDQMYQLFGMEKKFHGHSYDFFLKFIHPEDREAVKKSIHESLTENKPYSVTYRMVLPDGSERVILSQAEVIYDSTGEPVSMIGFAQDVTGKGD